MDALPHESFFAPWYKILAWPILNFILRDFWRDNIINSKHLSSVCYKPDITDMNSFNLDKRRIWCGFQVTGEWTDAQRQVRAVLRPAQELHDGISMKVFLAPNPHFLSRVPFKNSGANLALCFMEAHPRKISISALKILEKEILGSAVAELRIVYVNCWPQF